LYRILRLADREKIFKLSASPRPKQEGFHRRGRRGNIAAERQLGQDRESGRKQRNHGDTETQRRRVKLVLWVRFRALRNFGVNINP
jgi:hypothetical protein